MSKGKTGSRLIALLLAVLMLVAYMPMLGTEVYATDWGNTSTQTWGVTVSTDKAVYQEGEDIRLNVTGSSNVSGGPYGPWLGIYKAGGSYHTSLKYIDITEDIADASFCELFGYTDGLAPGSYHLILSDGAAGDVEDRVWATLDFTIRPKPLTPIPGYEVDIVPEDTFSEDPSADNHFITWDNYYEFYKTVTERSLLKIKVKVPSEVTGKAWVGLFECDETNYDATAYEWTYVNSAEDEIVFDLSKPSNPDYDGGTSGYRKVVLFKDGDYTPACEEMLFIRPAPGGTTEAESLVYTGSAQTPQRSQIKVLKPAGTVYRDVYWDVIFDDENSTKVGTYTYTIKFKYTVGGSIKGEYKIVDSFADPTFEWADDYSEATAIFESADPESEAFQEVPATVTKAETPATCDAAGKTVYTATVAAEDVSFPTVNEGPFTETKEVAIPAEGHKYGTPEYTWSEDNSKCTAKMVCEKDATHVVEETVEAKAETTAATCDAAGKIVYTATFENVAFEAQTKEVAGDSATGHKYGTPEYTWSEDNSKCTAKMVCENDATHVVEETVEAKAETTPAKCEAAGKTVYTATFENEAFEAQSKEVAIEATGHTPAEAVKEDGEDATCEAAGFHFDVVKCSVCGEEISRTKVEDPALGHDYQVVEGSAKAATFEEAGKEADKKCSRCGDEITGAEIPKLTAEASLSKTKFHYTGKVQKPEVKVAVNGTELDPKDFEVTIPSSKKIGAYKVTVKTTGDYAGFETTLNYQIAPKKVALKSVAKGTKSFTAKWAKQSATARKNIGGFQLRYSKDKNFAKGVVLSKKLSNKTTKWVKKGLKKKTKYYVQIRTYKKVNGKYYYSDWSKYKIVTTR